MIAWWGWLLIWTALVLALLALVALFAWRHIRRFLALLEDFFALTEKLEILDAAAPGDDVRPANSILRDPELVRREFDARMVRRGSIKRSRRQERIQRAKIITTAVITPSNNKLL